jgi:hypothetical protein
MTTANAALLAGALSANNPHVESISYTVSGGTAKTINACVNRVSGSNSRGAIGNRTIYSAEIIISFDSVSGIPVVTPKKDIVVMAAPELNSTSHTFLVVGIVGKSAMGWHLGLQQ